MEQQQRFWEAIAKIENVSRDITDIKDAVKQLTLAVGKLSIIEERQLVANASIERAFKEIDKHGLRIAAIELMQPLQQQTTTWVHKAMWLVIGSVITTVLALVLVGFTPAAPPKFSSPVLAVPK